MTHEDTQTQSDRLPQEMVDLIAAIAELPVAQRTRIEPILKKVVDGTRRRKRILSLVQEALSQLRLDMKYLMFDLEATRRERDSLQRQLEEGRDS
ncbi:MAG: transcriptional regulator [Planctomycetales bacterium]|nr:transcriptional regulator [Planctomycetales bacterium]